MKEIEVSAKSLNEAIIEACEKLGVTSSDLDIEVLEEGKAGLLGIGSKNTRILAKIKNSAEDIAKKFLSEVFSAMEITAEVSITMDTEEDEQVMNIEVSGENMALLIGKRGQTLDSLQYLVSLVVNKEREDHIRVKVDTENYRERRKETLENLAKNIAKKVARTRHSVTLEPMNPYERRIIHSALQNDRYVTTHSEGNEPYRKVVVTLKK